MATKASSQSALEEPELLTEVPPILKRLAKMTLHGFYDPEHIAVVNLLTRIPCIDEDTLMERLRFDKRQLRQTLARLRSDKLVKQRIHKEKQPETGVLNVYNFYFINYKVFVNVIKYKLDHIRRRLESEEQQARNRPSFTCEQCQSKFSDLEVDRLLDIATGMLRCPHCHGAVEEEMSLANQGNSRSTLTRFNEQMEPIYKLLQACENINLAPEVLEPEPSTLQLKNILHKNTAHSGAGKSGWTTDKKPVDLYDQSISVNVGEDANKPPEARKQKEAPIWMTQSTVAKNADTSSTSDGAEQNATHAGSKHTAIDEADILPDLLVHEITKKKPKLESKPSSADSSDTSEDSDADSITAASSRAVDSSVDNEKFIDDEDDDTDDDQHKVKIGSEMVPVLEVSEDMMKKMTPEEKDAYEKTYHDACDQFY